MRYMLEWQEVRGLMRMASPDEETAREEAKSFIRQGATASVTIFDIETSYPYKKVAAFRRPPKETQNAQRG